MSTATKSPYLNMIAKKRPWQAVPVDQGKLVEGSESTLFRALALRHLELPVREFLQQGLEKDLPSTPGVVEALEHNQKDEERHDEALNFIAAAHGVDEKAEKEAMNILKAWLEHPAHPILKAATLESLFSLLSSPSCVSMEMWAFARSVRISAVTRLAMSESIPWSHASLVRLQVTL